ncbi:hypothetical protein EDB87DRAFT_1691139 [Lactarius vividus]|nr:hypothetical protein EDB87DRAFT_1691139 [Lactarius vividus]
MEGPEELQSLAEEDRDDDNDNDDTPSMDDDSMTISRDRQTFPSNALRRIHALLVTFLPVSILPHLSEVESSQEEKGTKVLGATSS